ncbi:MAG: DNA topoisomerase I [Alphaproteobacteria bacterium GWC2_42_16]|nr:MAG: DNA topoisomerase I [Alphaproteobacteria bacterium GWC2_42_16]OFW73419.1 MAG: DNA topoisomerase I [Alphaproteobacteria bacterium GWA2_41_27]OFW82267.1 MAG: DNA topoisomerase I [Alphaproteobacteria bacterium RIFCSPHIGHO2_12_FULL_42_100]OFW86093.1 MAG: DNA topoisomerase I [Alphaproteobacteria bacterium RBG_16_42_14]OFW91652.1 MAG: DNA topoisomerase I [Alphaproteobacteria bacterium RIFCSPHIGHO2_02_FULL_42_30]OFW92670.1 MAG: DNA topoisomerase I [Alphaproteobacteria bacterium RIFCSPHIGHO2_1
MEKLMNVVVVESPSKARTIEKYLGKNYKVLASYGHVRDLVSKEGSVKPDEDFAMTWQVDERSKKHIDAITKALKGAGHLYLATDPDREGEAISWHIQEILAQKGALKDIKPERIAFNAITKETVANALAHPRPIDRQLVEAYLARLSLDYLVGFNLSPVLWRKLPGSRSAGRVQSVALRLVVERENEIETFKSQEYWTIEVEFLTEDQKPFKARLTHLDGKKLDKFSLASEKDARDAEKKIRAQDFHIDAIEKKRLQRHPRPPFITSTLQQEASRKLGFSPRRTMQLAQKLYEGVSIGSEIVGLITYMRTDSTQVEGSAIAACRNVIEKVFGKKYLPPSPRQYKTKVKNAQEAHEAIRPTDSRRNPQEMTKFLDHDHAKLYELIWKRMMASQMASAELDQTSVDVVDQKKEIILRATGSVLVFDGFLTLYRESLDADQMEDEDNKILPPLREKETAKKQNILPEQHFTQPPPRYTEASLVKKMEELGIGRPSTYARILQVLQERGYVKNEKRTLIPEDRGRIVTAFLLNYFRTYVEYDFTAQLEEQLDEISNGDLFWKDVLIKFWKPFHGAIDEAQKLKIQEVLEQLQKDLDDFLFPPLEGQADPHLCPRCKKGMLGLRLSKFGSFIGCSEYPECKYTRPLIVSEEGIDQVQEEPYERELGIDPSSGLTVKVKRGPYGFYIQWGEVISKKEKPKRASLTAGMNPDEITLKEALSLGALPRSVGFDPETKEPITAAVGRFGPYVKLGKIFASLKKTDDVLTIDLTRALQLIEIKKNTPPRKAKGSRGKKG